MAAYILGYECSEDITIETEDGNFESIYQGYWTLTQEESTNAPTVIVDLWKQVTGQSVGVGFYLF
jgi:hypothetical protein